jgi:type I restriction enzyme M protein
MRSANSISNDIFDIEGFAVIFLDSDGNDASSKRVADYPYQRAARGTWSVSQWKNERFAAAYPDFNVSVFGPDGKDVHGRTRLDNIRQSWISAVEEELEEEGESEVEGPIEITKLKTVASTKEQPKVATKTSVGRGASLSTDELKKFWDIANDLRKSLDAAEYKHIVLGLVFLKYISDSFEGRRAELEIEFADSQSERYKSDPKRRESALEERDYYKEVNVFWVPAKARWAEIQASSKQPKIAEMIDEALLVIERENPKLEGILERKYSDAKLTPAELGAVVDLIGTMSFGKGRTQASDTLGQVYEYFLGKFASAEGKLGGQFYTTPSIVKTLVEVLQPTKGRVYDPCCGSGGMFVQSERFVEAHGGKIGEISIYGQESNPTTRRLCAMNLAIRGMDFDLGKTHGDTFLLGQHKDLRADFILMNPPFGKNASYPKKELIDDIRWKKYGIPREEPANYAWMSHAVHHLAPKGRAGIVMPRGTLTSSQGGDDKIRTAFLDDDVIECVIDLPGQLFFNTQIPSCLWFFSKDKSKWRSNREGQLLFIDARKMGKSISNTQIEFSDNEIQRIGDTFRAWCDGMYVDIDGFCKSASREQIAMNGDSLSPGRYIGSEEVDSEDDEDFNTRMLALMAHLSEQLAESHRLEELIAQQLKGLGYEV